MMLATTLKFLSMGWVGGALLVGLLLNGEQLYSWVGFKALSEREEMQRLLDLMFITLSEERLKLFYSLYLAALFGLALLFFAPSVGACVFFGFFFVFLGWTLPRRFLSLIHQRRIKKFVVQMIDGLSLMSNGLRSGLNVPQALQIVTEELPNPISQEFALVLSQNKLGVTLEDAMSNLSVRMPADDIEMFTTSVNILKETGGNLAETFDTISVTIRERIKVESKIAAMVSQGVLQGVIVVLMPFALAAVLYAVDPERIAPMFTTIPGWVLLMAMMSLQFLGGFTIWKIVQIKV
jgi:tight adherence protein B